MKKRFLATLLKSLYDHPKHRRKIKYYVIAGIASTLLVIGLTIWAGFAAFSFAGQMASQITMPPEVLALREGLTNRNPETATACWNKAKGMMTVDTWLKTPIEENLRQLKDACSNSTHQQRSET